MEKMTLGKELSILIDLISKNSYSIVALIVLVVLAIIFIATNKKNAKFTKNIYIAIYAFIALFVLIAYNKYILDFLDYMMNNLFVAIYFPNLAIYFAAIVISNIIVLISIFNYRITKLIKNINIIIYTIITFLLVMLIGVITDKKLDIYSTTSIYDNANAHALIELTSIIFILWMVFLIIYRLIRMYQTNKYGEQTSVRVEKKIIEKPIIKEKVIKERVLPSNIVEVAIPNFARQGSLEIKLDEKELEQRANIEVEKRINTKIRESHAFDKMLTKQDYIVLLNLLKQTKERPLERLGLDKVEESTKPVEETKVEEKESTEVVEEKVETSTNENNQLFDEDDLDKEDEDTQVEETIETEETNEVEEEYYTEPKLIKVLEDDQSSYMRLQELYESVNL